VILDYDGTLSDTRPAITQCLGRAFAEHGRSAPATERVAGVVSQGLSLPETCLALDRNLRGCPGVLDEIVRTYRTLYRSEGEALTTMFPGAREALQHVHGRGIKCLVVSNKGAEAVQRSLERHELASFVDFVLADQPGIPHKPDPTLLTDHILARFPEIQRRHMLMVGDTEIDIQFAKRAGIACCWAAYGFGDRQRCRALAPEHQIESIGELPAVIRRPEHRG
jgi:phosphoglycolate phosphatase